MTHSVNSNFQKVLCLFFILSLKSNIRLFEEPLRKHIVTVVWEILSSTMKMPHTGIMKIKNKSEKLNAC